MLVLHLAEEQLGHNAQNVNRRHDNRSGRQDGEHAVEGVGVLERAEKDGHLGRETTQIRQSQRSQAGNHVAHTQIRHDVHHAAHVADVTRVSAAVNHTDQGKEQGRHQTVREHLQHRTGHRRGIEHEDGEEHHTAVAHTRVSVDILEVGLHTSAQRTIDDAGTREQQENPSQLVGGKRHQIDGDAETAVTSQFHQHTRVEHRHRRGRRGMTIGRPCMEWEHGTQHAEADKCQREQQILPIVRNGIVMCNIQDVHRQGLTSRCRVEIDTNQAEHQEGRATHQHQRQFHRAIVLVTTTPHTNEQVHGNQSNLIEHEHREQVNRDKETEHTRGQQEEPHEELTRHGVHLPRSEDSGEHDERRQQNHHHAHSVDTQSQVNIERGVPHHVAAQDHLVGDSGASRLQEDAHQPSSQHHEHTGTDDCNGPDGLDALIAANGQASKREQRHDHKVNQYIIENFHCISFPFVRPLFRVIHKSWQSLPSTALPTDKYTHRPGCCPTANGGCRRTPNWWCRPAG